jgi:hypothetical protein
MPHDNFLLPGPQVSPVTSISSMGSSSPPSPDSTPFSPTSALLANSFAQLTMPSSGNGEQQPPLEACQATDAHLALNLHNDFQFAQQPDLKGFCWESDSLWASSGDTLLTNDDFDLRAIPPIELELPKCNSDDVVFNTAPGLVFGQDFTQALEGHHFDHPDSRHMNSILMFDEMMAGHGF